METFHYIRSFVADHNKVPTLFVNDKPVSALAYISYLDESARYDDFTHAGYRIYSFPAYFGGRGINVHSGIKGFRRGIYDRKGEPDFTVFDLDIDKILQACPDAMIFPRICMMMPEWWEKENPGELNQLSDGSFCRESFSSQKWRDDAAEMLSLLIGHIEESSYRNNIVAYHIAEGGTEEWVHFGNPVSGFGESAGKGFVNFIRTNHPDEEAHITGLPTFYAYDAGNEFIDFKTDKALIRFLEYTNWIIADTICYFASFIKERTSRRLAVGAFYGYTLELTDPRNGHHALKKVLESPDVDFLCSPNSYMHGRGGGYDWPNMSVLDSVKSHGKLWLSECDTRTYLTRPLKESRSWICSEGTYEGGVWEGPSSPEISLWFLRKNFARNLITGIGLWWFDMWGGWFADKRIMDEMAEYLAIAESSLNDTDRSSIAEVAVIVDESAYRYLNPMTDLAARWTYEHRFHLGISGVPYDIYDISDMEIIPDRYKLIIFAGLFPDDSCTEDRFDLFLMHRTSLGNTVFCSYHAFGIRNGYFDPDNTSRRLGFDFKTADTVLVKPVSKGFITFSPLPEIDLSLLRTLYNLAGVHVFCDSGDVIYAGNNYIAIHAASEGIKTIVLQKEFTVKELFSDNSSFIGNTISVTMEKFETLIYAIRDGGIVHVTSVPVCTPSACTQHSA